METLVEVFAQHFYGDDKKWGFIAVTEAIKALVRLALFRDSGYKMLLHGGEVINAEKDLNASEFQHDKGHFVKPGENHGASYFGKFHDHNLCNLEGRALLALNKFGENARMASNPTWLKRLQSHHALAADVEPPALIEKPNISTIWSTKGLPGGLFVLGEVLFIMRPLIYVLFIRKYGVRSWIPWLVSLTVDLTGHGFLSQVTNLRRRSQGNSIVLSPSEKDEVRRRKLLWVLYLMRDPFFSKYTRHRLDRAEKLLNPVPIVGFLTAKLVELLIGAQTRYTYTSGS